MSHGQDSPERAAHADANQDANRHLVNVLAGHGDGLDDEARLVNNIARNLKRQNPMTNTSWAAAYESAYRAAYPAELRTWRRYFADHPPVGSVRRIAS